MKKVILMVSVVVLAAGGLAAIARQKKAEQVDPNLPYKFKKKCTAYVERNPDRSSPYKKYYVGECVFQFDFHGNTSEPINLIPLYKKYANTDKFYPFFSPDKCTFNLKQEKFNFSRFHPKWYKLKNNQIDAQKVEDEEGHEFSFTANINTEYDDGMTTHTITAELVCIGPSRQDVRKHTKKQQAQADKQ